MNKTIIYIHALAADYLNSLGNPDAKIQISEFITKLGSNPELCGDYRQPDPRGRMMEVKLIGRQAIIFFKDPFANLVKVLDIRNIEAL
ncbi:hypothetical protein OAI07_00520 [Akkermansiaceae bacterium]|nr:hypothetical protein [Akkermansiaceae bacterium]